MSMTAKKVRTRRSQFLWVGDLIKGAMGQDRRALVGQTNTNTNTNTNNNNNTNKNMNMNMNTNTNINTNTNTTSDTFGYYSE